MNDHIQDSGSARVINFTEASRPEAGETKTENI